MPGAPLVVIPARFSETASAHRHRALSTARSLSTGVLLAGGEPLAVQPWAPDGRVSPDEVGRRLEFADAVLLPGGGDLAPETYGAGVDSDQVYGVENEQDAFDLAVARWALTEGVPLLAVCRGWQVVNVALGGTLEQHMADPHRHRVHEVTIDPGNVLASAVGASVSASCFHHQRVIELAPGLVPVARSDDGTVEAAVLPAATGWFLAVQWHPEDTVERDPAQLAIFQALIAAAHARRAARRPVSRSPVA